MTIIILMKPYGFCIQLKYKKMDYYKWIFTKIKARTFKQYTTLVHRYIGLIFLCNNLKRKNNGFFFVFKILFRALNSKYG